MPIRFQGGPFDGITADPGAGAGGPAEPGLQEPLAEEQSTDTDWGALPEVEHFNKLLDGVRALASKIDSEQNKLKLEKVTTFLQEIRAADEAEEESALQGKASPRLMRRAYSGSGSGGGASGGGLGGGGY